MNKTIAFFLAMVATSALWAADFEVNGIAYNITDATRRTVEVTSRTARYSGSITIPSSVSYGSKTYSVTKIGTSAFYESTSLLSITIPNSVTYIGNGAFSGCNSLTSVSIPSSVTIIEDGAFSRCLSLPTDNNIRYADTYLVGAVDKTKSTYTIKEGTKWIGSNAFHTCTSLTSITIPNSVIDIQRSVFEACTSLTSVTIPNSVTSIGVSAFMDCTSLLSVTIPNSVTSIGTSAFNTCTSLQSVTIPNSVTSIGNGAFTGCDALPVENNLRYADTYLVGAVDKTKSTFTIKEGTKWIGSDAFRGCASLQSITIPNSVIHIGLYAFYESALKSVNIPNSVIGIEGSAFYGLPLTTVVIGEGLDTIAYYAFRECTALTSITCYAITPPACGLYCFDNVDHTIPLYVPANSISAYQSANQWQDFTNIKAIPDPTALNQLTDSPVNRFTKVIKNGRLLIQRANHTYLATGQEM